MNIDIKIDVWENKERLIKMIDKLTMFMLFIFAFNAFMFYTNAYYISGTLNLICVGILGLIQGSVNKFNSKKEVKEVENGGKQKQKDSI